MMMDNIQVFTGQHGSSEKRNQRENHFLFRGKRVDNGGFCRRYALPGCMIVGLCWIERDTMKQRYSYQSQNTLEIQSFHAFIIST